VTEPRADTTVSVVIPCFNGARFLGEALSSALEQQPPPGEIIVQDAGSTDGSASIAASFGDRVSFVSEPDAGQSDALNCAIARATGEWIVWLNADDVLAPGVLAAADAGADIVYGDFDYIDEHGALLRQFRPGPELTRERLLADGCYLFSGAALFRRSLFERHGGLDVNLRYTMDYELYLRVAPHVRATYVPRTLGAFRVHGHSKTQGLTWPIFVETARLRRRYGGYGPATRRPVLVNQAKQLVDLATLPARRRLGWR
jgi:glycosyltransferase involved in cell wall biosynthesis